MSSGGDSCSTIGYRYFAGLHLIFCHAADKLLSIGVGEKVAWEGEVTENATLQINKPQLFGGDDREGGIVGAVDVCFGLPTQAKNSYLQSILGANIPAFRGLFGLIANRCQLSALNPYIKPWWIIAQRTETGWQSDLAEIVAPDGYVDMNPAHIIREALTNTTWGGLGYPEADLDDDSFQAAAYTLGQGDDPNQEALGLSFLWAKNTSIDDFIGAMLQCIDGVLFFSHITGLLTLKLVRNDYTPAMLPVFDASNILELVEYSAPTATEAVNQVTVVWVDRNNTARGSTVHDVAGIDRANGQTIPLSIEFPGVTNEELALKLAARELQQVCVPLASCTLLVNRKNWGLEPGDCFVLNWAPIGLSGVVFRVTSVEVGLHTEGQLRIKAARDVYGLGPVALTEPAESLWSSPYSAPADAVYRNVQEITWWQFVRAYGESEAVLAELTDDSTGVICFCGRPSPDAINYEMWSRNTGEADYTKRDTDSFPFIGTTAAALDPEVSSTIALQQSYIDTNLVKVGQYAALGDELVAVTAIDTVNVTVTVDRGILDTIPVSHAAGETVWFYQGLFGLDQTPRTEGEQVEVKILPSTTQGRLEIDDAATNTKTLEGRMMRPYPPGNVKVNGALWPDVQLGLDSVATWAHRDRLLQTVGFTPFDSDSIGPEAGTTYTATWFLNGSQVSQEAGIEGTTASYSYVAGGTAKLTLESIRDGLESFQAFSHEWFIDADVTLWTPGEITTAQWLDYGDASTLTWDTGLSVLADKSGNGRNATQATASYQPVDSSGLLLFDGAGDFMGMNVPQALPCHAFFVINAAALQTGNRSLLGRYVVSTPYPPALYVGGSVNYKPGIYWGSGWVLNYPTAVNTGLIILEFALTASTVSIRVNGGTASTAGHSASASALTYWSALITDYAPQAAALLFGESLIINELVGDAAREQIEGYLAWKWDAITGGNALVSGLPAGHSYKTAPPYSAGD